MAFSTSKDKGKMGPAYTHPNIPQGGNPGGSQPGKSRVECGVGNLNKGTAGRKTWPKKSASTA